MTGPKKLLTQLEAASRGRTRPSRSNRTIALREPQARTLWFYCKARGYHVQDVLDLLIEQFLDEVKDDIPSELLPTKSKTDGAA